MRRHTGTLLALLIAAATLGIQTRRHPPPQRYDRFDLPAFDAHVYLAMAEHPAVFTVAPWGYRVLTPALVHSLPVRTVAKGFRYVALGGLGLSALLLFLWLRRLGAGEGAALAAVAVFGLSGPVAEAVRYRFLVEPATLALELGLLLALDAGCGLGVLGLLLTLGALSKEFALLLVPLVLLHRWRRDGPRRALLLTPGAALPAVLATLLLRWGWAPHLSAPLPGPATLVQGLARLAESWPQWWVATLLHGLTPLAVMGAVRAAATPLRAPLVYLAAIALLAPFLNPLTFFPQDVPRLLLYALPAALALALVALDAVWPHLRPPGPSAPVRRGVEVAAAVASLGLLLALPFALDRYRRVDLSGPRDGPLVLALCRESLRTAGRLERGQTVRFEAEEQRFAWGESDPGALGRMRWFLRAGWGERAHYGTDDIRMQAARATLLLPVLRPAALAVALTLDAPAPLRLRASVNGRPVGEGAVGSQPVVVRLKVPADALFRGDNELSLEAVGGAASVRLSALEIRPAE